MLRGMVWGAGIGNAVLVLWACFVVDPGLYAAWLLLLGWSGCEVTKDTIQKMNHWRDK